MKWSVAAGLGLRVGVCLTAMCAASISTALAQSSPPGGANGVIVGLVAKCVNNVEQPLQGASVQAESGYAIVTDQNGQFAFSLPAGNYNLTVTSSDGNGSRPNVPVIAGQLLDVGIIDVGPAAIMGCGAEAQPAAPTATPVPATAVPTDTPVPPSPTPLPPTATPVPSDQSPDMTPGDQSVPATTSPDTAPDDSGGGGG
jgi:hypothetical protein